MLFIKKKRTNSFEDLTNKIKDKLVVGWKSKMLSWSSKTTLVKLYLTNIAIYSDIAFKY